MLRIDSSIIWVIVNLVIFFILIRIFLFKPILGIIEKRKQMIEEGFNAAETAKKDAEDLKAEYEEALKGAKDESIRIVEDANARAEVVYNDKIREAEDKSKQLMDKTYENIEKEREKALSDIEKEISTLAMAAAEKIVGESGSRTTDEKLFDEFLEKNGEQND